jgi:hypothetical protein
MSGNERTFGPAYQSGVTETAGAVSKSKVIDKDGHRKSVVVTNTGTDPIYVRCGKGSSIVATTADYLVLGGTQVSISKDPFHDYIAVIAPAGAPVMHAISGTGF